MSWRFNSFEVSEKEKEARLICKLEGFKPSEGGHSAHTNVENDTLIVTAHMAGKKYELKVPSVGVENDAVHCKPKKDEVNVIITKPNKEYSLSSKLPK